MWKKAVIVIAALLLAAPAVAADSTWTITLGIGGGIPAKDDGFVDNARTGVYRMVWAEYPFSERLSGYGQYDKTTFDAQEGAEKYSATTLGAGVVVYFDLIPKNDWELGVKVGASKASKTDLIPDPSWANALGAFVQGDFNGNVRFRIGCDFRTFQNSDEIAAFEPYLAINFAPTEIWK
jgi:hypothetical protein